MKYLSINFGIDRFQKYLKKQPSTPLEYNEKEIAKLNEFDKYIKSILEKVFKLDVEKDIESIKIDSKNDIHFNHFYSKVTGSCDYKRYLIDRKKLNIKYKDIEKFIKTIINKNDFNLRKDLDGHWSCCEECNLSGVICSINCPNGVTLINKRTYLFIQIFAQQLDDFALSKKYENKAKEVGILEDQIFEEFAKYKTLDDVIDKQKQRSK